MGLTLTAASAVVFAEGTWTPAMMVQAEDRAHRIGQKQNVCVYYLIGRDTIDEVMFGLVEEKAQVVSGALDGFRGGMNIEELDDDEQVKIEKTHGDFVNGKIQPMEMVPMGTKGNVPTNNIFDFEPVDYDMKKITIKAKKKKSCLEDDSEWEEFGGEANRDSADFPSLRCHLKAIKGDYIDSQDEDEK